MLATAAIQLNIPVLYWTPCPARHGNSSSIPDSIMARSFGSRGERERSCNRSIESVGCWPEKRKTPLLDLCILLDHFVTDGSNQKRRRGERGERERVGERGVREKEAACKHRSGANLKQPAKCYPQRPLSNANIIQKRPQTWFILTSLSKHIPSSI